MDASRLKEKIVEDDKIEAILTELGCHKIKFRNGGLEIRAALPDGNNATAVQVYIDTLLVHVYTRDDFGDANNTGDIITLTEYITGLYFTKAINWLCQVCGYDYYDNGMQQYIEDPCVSFLRFVEPKAYERLEETPLRKYDETILGEYQKLTNIWFYNDGIDYAVQRLFEVCISYRDDRITIPIRDELGNLVGVKGRTTLDLIGEIEDLNSWGIPKYNYIYKCPKGQLLFGLDKAFQYIKEKKEVIVFESEKAVMQAWSMGYKNCVSIGGHKLTPIQVLKLEKLGANVILAFDKDIEGESVRSECAKFILGNGLSVIYDKDNLLGKQKYIIDEETQKKKPQNKKSPTDLGKEVFERLYQNYCYGFKGAT